MKNSTKNNIFGAVVYFTTALLLNSSTSLLMLFIKENSDRWRSGAVLPIIIEYYNFEGRKFIEKSELRFAPDNAFAFYSWS